MHSARISDPADRTSPTPLVLGDYVLLSKIGAGGMGQVFKAQHRVMERLVAIKLLPPALVKDEDAVKRFQREVKAAAKLSHPNIVAAHDARKERGVWCLVMEYVEGRDLAHVVAQEGPLPITRAVDYIRQAARGLAYHRPWPSRRSRRPKPNSTSRLGPSTWASRSRKKSRCPPARNWR